MLHKCYCKSFNTNKIAILQVFDNNENTGEEIFARIVNSIGVTEEKIKQSLARCFLHRTARKFNFKKGTVDETTG